MKALNEDLTMLLIQRLENEGYTAHQSGRGRGSCCYTLVNLRHWLSGFDRAEADAMIKEETKT